MVELRAKPVHLRANPVEYSSVIIGWAEDENCMFIWGQTLLNTSLWSVVELREKPVHLRARSVEHSSIMIGLAEGDSCSPESKTCCTQVYNHRLSWGKTRWVQSKICWTHTVLSLKAELREKNTQVEHSSVIMGWAEGKLASPVEHRSIIIGWAEGNTCWTQLNDNRLSWWENLFNTAQ